MGSDYKMDDGISLAAIQGMSLAEIFKIIDNGALTFEDPPVRTITVDGKEVEIAPIASEIRFEPSEDPSVERGGHVFGPDRDNVDRGGHFFDPDRDNVQRGGYVFDQDRRNVDFLGSGSGELVGEREFQEFVASMPHLTDDFSKEAHDTRNLFDAGHNYAQPPVVADEVPPSAKTDILEAPLITDGIKL